MPDVWDGFTGQRLAILPRPTLAGSLAHPLLGSLCVSDCGRFPVAAGHRRERAGGSPQIILMFCSQGRGWVEVHGRRHAVGPGRLVVIPPDQPHAYGADAGQPWTLWWLHLAGAQVSAWGARLAGPVVAIEDPARVVALIDEILSGLERDDGEAAQLAASGTAVHLLGLLASGRLVSDEGPVARVLHYMRDRLDGQVGVAELAQLAGLSRSRFCDRFQAVVGHSPLAHLTRLKMARARELLDGTELPIAEVAARLGYRDAFYFSRAFRKMHAASPRAWRAQRKG